MSDDPPKKKFKLRNAPKHAMALKQYDAEELQVPNALTPEEKELCQHVTVFGANYLRHNKGWKADNVKRFLGRSEVQREINTLKLHYEDRTGIQERTQFFAQLRINGMVPAATNLLARALRGTYKDPGSGKQVDPPTKQQLEAAVQVLDRANVQGQLYNGNDATPAIDARTVNIAMGFGDSTSPGMSNLDSAGREKVRGILSAVLNKSRAVAAAGERLKGKDSIRDKLGEMQTTPSETDEEENPDDDGT